MELYCEHCEKHIKPQYLERHVKSKGHLKAAGIIDSVKNFFSVKNGYNNQSTKTINKFGDMRVMKINVYRKPIDSALDKVLNFISLGKFDEGKKLSNIDSLFHLGLFCVLNDSKGQFFNVICEKNATIHIEQVSFNINGYGENIPVHVNKNITLNQLLQGGQNVLGDKYFYYDGFNGNNCQVYVKSLLEGSGLYSPNVDKFVFQPLDKIIATIPKSTPVIAKAVTSLGAWFEKITGKGKPKRSVRFKKTNK